MIKKPIEYLLFKSGITNYQISKETGIRQTTLGKYTTRKSEIGNMSLDNAEKLHAYFKEIFKTKEIECNHDYTGFIFDEKVCMLCGVALKIESGNDI